MTDLVDQMRTCAAAIAASQASGHALDISLMASDAARLLTEAADLLAVQQEPLAAILSPLPPQLSRRTRHFDDGSKHNLVRGNDPQAMRSIGRQK